MKTPLFRVLKFRGMSSNTQSIQPRQTLSAVIIQAIAIAVTCVAATQIIFPAHFETADDLNFCLLLSGVGLTDAPTYQTWFTNFLITYPLMWMYQWLPDITWYSFYLFAVLIVGFSLVAIVLMLRFNRAIGTILFLIYYICIGVFIVNGLQYTSTTALLTQSGFLLAFALPLAKRFKKGKIPNWVLISAFAATVFASMIRFEPFLLVLLISAITLLVVAPKKFSLLKRAGRTLICFAVAVAIGFALKTASNYYYDSQPAFAGVREFFRPFSDLADSDRKKTATAKIELSDNDYALVKQFFVAEKSVFTTPSLTNAVNASSLPFTMDKLSYVFWGNIAPIGLLFLAIVWFLDPKFMSVPHLLLFFLGTAALVLYLAFFMKLPTRVHLTLLTCTVTTLFMFLDRTKLKKLARRLVKANKVERSLTIPAACLIAGVTIFISASLLSSITEEKAAENENVKEAIAVIKPAPEKLYIVLGTTTPYQFMLPFQNLRPHFAGFDIYRTSLWSRMPIGDAMLRKHGFKDLKEACQSPNVLFISNPSANKHFAQFCKEHYGMDAKFTSVYENQMLGMSVFKLQLTPEST